MTIIPVARNRLSFYNCSTGGDHGSESGSGAYNSSDHSVNTSDPYDNTAHHRRFLGAEASGSESIVVECPGLWIGMLEAQAFFSCLYRLWMQDLLFRSKYSNPDYVRLAHGGKRTHDKQVMLHAPLCTQPKAACPPHGQVHTSLELTFYVLLILASQFIHSSTYYRSGGYREAEGFMWMAIYLIIIEVVWVIRYLELAIPHPLEAVRRSVSDNLHGSLIKVILYTMAFLAAVASNDDKHTRGEHTMLAVSAVFTLLGSQIIAIRQVVIYYRNRWLRRWHHITFWPRERTAVPLNVDFVIHRCAEFMFLMLGETVLQLVIAYRPTADASSQNRKHVAPPHTSPAHDQAPSGFAYLVTRACEPPTLARYGVRHGGHQRLLGHAGHGAFLPCHRAEGGEVPRNAAQRIVRFHVWIALLVEGV